MGLPAASAADDFSRKVYCILGIPVDDITMEALVKRIFQAAWLRSRLFISTPNLNFVMLSLSDPEFRQSLLESDICPADGIGVLLICSLLGVPIRSRVSGSDLPSALQASPNYVGSSPLRLALFGGDPGVGDLARTAINARNQERLICIAAIDPGKMTADMMTDPAMVKRVNATSADFLLVALGGKKGQAWLLRNLKNLEVPVISHLGATLNFLAGTVKRAPVGFRRLGLEWLWRVKEEPRLASRYLSDGAQLMWLLLTRIAPLGFWLRWNKVGCEVRDPRIRVVAEGSGRSRIIIEGAVRDDRLQPVASAFRSTVLESNGIILDLAGLKFFEMGFAGYILMLEKATQKQAQVLMIAGASAGVARALAWCGLKHLIENSRG